MIARLVLGFALALAVSLAALRTRSLTAGGAAMATAIGTLAIAAGWSWGALLIIYFVSSSALSRIGRAQKEQRTGSVVAKGGGRDAVQVLANGALFAGAALAMLIHPHVQWIALGAGSLAASAADTWATEIGTLSRHDPRSILSGRRVPPGTSGGVSLIGTLATIAGATFIAALVHALGWTPAIAVGVGVGGLVGAVIDSLLGATLQARRWCDVCAGETERATHDCMPAPAPPFPTRHLRGLAWMDNDVVNFLSSAAGGLLAAVLSR
jgi:uncharacterized protein (TIGR00297 family)